MEIVVVLVCAAVLAANAMVHLWRDRGTSLFIALFTGLLLIGYFTPWLLSLARDTGSRSGEPIVLVYTAITFGTIAASVVARRLVRPRRPNMPLQVRPQFRVVELCYAVSLVLLYGVALYLGTLRVGLDTVTALPFRLNGVLRSVSLVQLPVILVVMLEWRLSRWIVTLVVVVMSSINLAFTGSKFSAAVPILAACLTYDRNKVVSKYTLLVACIFGAMYTVINPFYARAYLASSRDADIVYILKQSVIEGGGSARSGADIMDGLDALLRRVTGHEDLTNCISLATRVTPFSTTATLEYNRFLAQPSLDTNSATGFFGYFIIYTGSVYGGLIAAVVVLLLLLVGFYAIRRLPLGDYLGVVFIASILPLVVDGRFDYLTSYLDCAFNLIAVGGFLWYLMRKKMYIQTCTLPNGAELPHKNRRPASRVTA